MKYLAPQEARTKIGNIKYLEQLRILSRFNRCHPTRSELLFWNIVVRKHKSIYKFTRQKPIGRFIIDFYSSKLLLAIEIDGGSHQQKKYVDTQRDLYLKQRGIVTIRYTDWQILNEIKKVQTNLDLQINLRQKQLQISPFQGERRRSRKGF